MGRETTLTLEPASWVPHVSSVKERAGSSIGARLLSHKIPSESRVNDAIPGTQKGCRVMLEDENTARKSGFEGTAGAKAAEGPQVEEWQTVRDQPVSFSVGRSGYSSVHRNDETWGRLLPSFALHTEHPRVSDKKKLPVYAPCVLRDYSVPAPVGNKKPKNLKNKNVAEITMLVFDIDNSDAAAMQSPLQATTWLLMNGVAHAYHSSWSSAAQRPKYRIVVAITEPVVLATDEDRAAYKLAYERAMATMGVDGDRSCSDAAQYYISPAVANSEISVSSGKQSSFGPYEDGKAHFGAWTRGRAFDLGALVEEARKELDGRRSQRNGAAHAEVKPRGPHERITQAGLQTPGLYEFNSKYRLDLDIEALVRHSEPDGIRGPAAGGGIHCRCPNQHGEVTGRPHTDESDTSTSFWVRNPQDEQGYVIKCHTAGCGEHFGGDALLLLDAMCERYGIKDASELIPFSDTAQRDAAQREEALRKHKEAWESAEALGADDKALKKAATGFNTKPTDEALTAILKALATLDETSVIVGSTIDAVRKSAHQPVSALRKKVNFIRGEYLRSKQTLEADDLGQHSEEGSAYFDPPHGKAASTAPCVRGEWDHQDQVRVAKAILEHQNRQQLRIYRGADGDCVRIVRKVVNTVEQHVIEELDRDAWAHELGVMIEYRKTTQSEGDKGRVLPEAVVAELRGDLTLDLPRLVRVTDVPLHSASGTLRVTPGYDPDTETFLVPGFAIRMPPAVGEVTEAHVREAEDILIEGLRDFPFSDVFNGKELLPIYTDEIGADGHRIPNWDRGMGSRVNVIGCLVHCFTPNLRTGPSPSYHIDKPKMATGAGYLANFISIVRDGRRMVPTPLPKSEEEIEKRITALRLGGGNFIMWDNIRNKVESESLALYETGDTYRGRKLGESSSPIFPTDVPMIYTTNNGTFTSEHYRRKVAIRLDASKAKPRERTGFKYQPYAEKMLSLRPDFVWAIHVLINNWLQKGRPAPSQVPYFASYPEWTSVVGGVLEAAGIYGLLSNMEAYLEGKDDDGDGETDLIERIHATFGMTPFTAREVYTAFQNPMTSKWDIDSVPLDLHSDAKAIKQLSEHIGQNLEGGTFEIDGCEFKVAQANNRSPKQWCLMQVRS